MSAELLEREQELEQISESLERARQGHGEILLIEGPAGIGKTRLAHRAASLAEEHGVRVLTARATEIEREFPFGAARQLFSPVLRDGSESGLLEGAASLAARVLEDPSAIAPEPTPPSSDAQFAALHGLYWLLSNLADQSPVQIVIDDLQWADEPSLRFAQFLAPRIAELPVQVTLSMRSGEHGPHDELIDHVAAEASTHRLIPSPLSVDAIGHLLEHLLDSEPDRAFVEAAHETVGGNPLFLELMAEELRRQGVAPVEAAAHRVRELGPQTISRSVLLRCAGLARGAPSLARAVAILGNGARVADAAILSEIDHDAAVAAADALGEAAILARNELSFVHPVVRNAIYEDIGGVKRAAMHRQAADLLIAQGASSERIASQLVLAERTGDPPAVRALREAARLALARGAPRIAAGYLSRALEEPPAPDERAAILLELGSAEARAGIDQAREHLADAVSLAAESWVQVVATIELAQVRSYAGEFGEAVKLVRQALEQLDADEVALSRVAEMALMVLAESDVEARRGSTELIEQAIAAVGRLGERAPRGLVAIAAVESAFTGTSSEEAGDLAERALEGGRLFEEQGPDMPHAGFAAGTLVMSGRFERAEEILGIAIDLTRERGSMRGYGFASAVRAWARFRSGRLDGALGDAEACLELGPGPGWALFRPLALSALIDSLIDQGEIAEATTALEDSEVERSAPPGSMLTQSLRESGARLKLARGDAAEAIELLDRCAEWEREWGARGGTWTGWRSTAALAHAALGDNDEAEALATEEVELAREFGAPRQLGIALRALGLATGGEQGVELLGESVSILNGSGARLEHARALIDHGSALRRANQRRSAREPLKDGLELAGECGAQALVDRARAELSAAGGRPRKVVRSGIDSLTPSERRVAELAAEGRSNPEIAQALFVTRKTVEAHMRMIFRKLDISVRGELGPLIQAASSV